MEMQKVPEAGYRIEGAVDQRVAERQLTTDNLAFPLKVASSVIKSFRILDKFRPRRSRRRRRLRQRSAAVCGQSEEDSGNFCRNKNSYAGLTNKMLANQVQKICVAHHGMERFFPKEKLVFTGNPIRHDIVTLAAEGRGQPTGRKGWSTSGFRPISPRCWW